MYLNPSFDLGINLNIGELDIQNGFIQGNPRLSETAFSKTYANTYLFGRFKFANGNILPANCFIKPYLNAGIGITAYGGGDENLKNGITLLVPGTFGLDVPLTETVKLYVQSTYNRTFADGFDGSDRLDSRSHDDYLIYAAGVKVALSASKRESHGGGGMQEPDYNAPVPPRAAEKTGESSKNKAPEAVANPKGTSFNGKKDKPEEISATDSDGLTNKKKHEAVSDTDKNGLSNKAQKPKEKKGKAVEIPDTDGDGLNDEIDSCPQLAGVNYLKGCPDADGDRLGDAEDECPKIAGPATLEGCPEVKEKSEVVIEEDKEEPVKIEVEEEQPAAEDSIQELSADLKNKVGDIYNEIQYMPGKATLMDSSKDDLDKLAQIMEENPKLQLIIEGYTDNAGEASYNLLLSKDRADAVKQYLIGKGIEQIRLRAEGYGEILPIAPNNTETGRAQNRRVELRLTYHWVL